MKTEKSTLIRLGLVFILVAVLLVAARLLHAGVTKQAMDFVLAYADGNLSEIEPILDERLSPIKGAEFSRMICSSKINNLRRMDTQTACLMEMKSGKTEKILINTISGRIQYATASDCEQLCQRDVRRSYPNLLSRVRMTR